MSARHQPKSSALPPIDLNPRRDTPLDFPDRAYGELTAQDYQELGFLCGLEVHQQLLTRSKLFCRCPAGLRVENRDAELLRHMRPTLSEMGEYDGCALMEFKTRKEIVYLLERSTVCTYEMDDTPPFEIDEEAVRAALQISRLFGLQLVSELQVMRKQYLDGSIPTGFQRTAMVGIGGTIPFTTSELGSSRELRIRQLTLEEDSCREVSDIGHRIVFRTDRLGTPLIETVTEPDLLTPADVAAGGRLLAQVARVSHRVRRGSGAARQDVNVSIAGSRRVELKGTNQHSRLPRLVHNEAYRHLNLLRIRQELQARGLEPALLETDGLWLEVGSLLAGCQYSPIAAALECGQVVAALRLPGFNRLLARPTQPGIPFAQEFAERVRVIACLVARPFMLVRDLASKRLPARTWAKIRKALGADTEDSLLLLWGSPEDVETACQEVLLRARETFTGVPSETRQAHANGTTGFERILPGPERMYPDTDTPPLPIQDSWVEEIDEATWELPWERAKRYQAGGLLDAPAERLAVAPWAGLFDELRALRPKSRQRLAHAFEKRLPRHRNLNLPQASRLRPLVDALDAGQLHPSGTEFVLDRLLQERETSAEIIVFEHCKHPEDQAVLERRLRQISAQKRTGGLQLRSDETALRWAMGELMRSLPRGRLDPLLAREELIQALGLRTGGRP